MVNCFTCFKREKGQKITDSESFGELLFSENKVVESRKQLMKSRMLNLLL